MEYKIVIRHDKDRAVFSHPQLTVHRRESIEFENKTGHPVTLLFERDKKLFGEDEVTIKPHQSNKRTIKEESDLGTHEYRLKGFDNSPPLPQIIVETHDRH